MASLNLSATSSTTLSWYVSGLSNAFNTTNYMSVVLSNSSVTDGTNTTPSYYQYISAPSSGSSTTTPTGSDSGYIAGSTVTLYGIAHAANGKWYNIGSSSITFPSPPLPSSPSGLSISGASLSQFTVNWSNGANTNYQEVWLQGYGTNNASNGATSYTRYGLSLSYGTTYFVTLTPYNAQGSGSGSTTSFSIPFPPPSGLTGLSATGNNGYVHLSWNASSGATNYNISWTGYSFGSASTGNTDTSRDVFLPNNHTWTFTVTPTNSSGSGSSQSDSATTSNRPENFSWTTGTWNGTTIVKVSGDDFTLTATEWSTFKNTINGFRDHLGLSAYPFSTSPTTGQNFTANMYLEVRQAVHDMENVYPYNLVTIPIPARTLGANIVSGGNIYAYYLTDLSTSLNSIA